MINLGFSLATRCTYPPRHLQSGGFGQIRQFVQAAFYGRPGQGADADQQCAFFRAFAYCSALARELVFQSLHHLLQIHVARSQGKSCV